MMQVVLMMHRMCIKMTKRKMILMTVGVEMIMREKRLERKKMMMTLSNKDEIFFLV